MINDFPTISLQKNEFITADGDFIKVPMGYKQHKHQIAAFYRKVFLKGENHEVLFGTDALGFNYVYYNKLCYIGLIVSDDKKLSVTAKTKAQYAGHQFSKTYLENHIKKELKFRNYEEFVPIEIVTKNIHELRNLNSKISSHIDSLLNVENENEWETKFENSNPDVKKIYVGSRLTKFILDNLKFYNPNYLESLKIDYTKDFVAHKSVLKIVKIFQNNFKRKKSNISFTGSSHRHLHGEKEYFEILLMLLIENAIKYSTDIERLPPKVSIKESEFTIDIKISSWGAIVKEDEREKIFHSGFRATHQHQKALGTGMGLYNAKKLAKIFNATIVYEPEKTHKQSGWNDFYLICRTKEDTSIRKSVL